MVVPVWSRRMSTDCTLCGETGSDGDSGSVASVVYVVASEGGSDRPVLANSFIGEC